MYHDHLYLFGILNVTAIFFDGDVTFVRFDRMQNPPRMVVKLVKIWRKLHSRCTLRRLELRHVRFYIRIFMYVCASLHFQLTYLARKNRLKMISTSLRNVSFYKEVAGSSQTSPRELIRMWGEKSEKIYKE